MDSDGSVLSKLFLGLVNLSEEVYEAFPALRHALFRPIGELELADGARRTIASICELNILNIRMLSP